MRDAVVDGELQHLRINHDQPALLGIEPVEQAQDHGVDRHRLAGAGGAGDQQMRHLGEIDDHRLAADGLAERDRQLVAGLRKVLRGQHLAQIDGLALLVGQFDADGVAALHDGDAGGDRRHRARDVVGEADDARGFDARRRLQLVERHHRAGAHVDDLALDAEIVEHAFEQRARSAPAHRRRSCARRSSSARPASPATGGVYSPRSIGVAWRLPAALSGPAAGVTRSGAGHFVEAVDGRRRRLGARSERGRAQHLQRRFERRAERRARFVEPRRARRRRRRWPAWRGGAAGGARRRRAVERVDQRAERNQAETGLAVVVLVLGVDGAARRRGGGASVAGAPRPSAKS